MTRLFPFQVKHVQLSGNSLRDRPTTTGIVQVHAVKLITERKGSVLQVFDHISSS